MTKKQNREGQTGGRSRAKQGFRIGTHLTRQVITSKSKSKSPRYRARSERYSGNYSQSQG